ncbi:MAG: ParB/RepB/Spo0J family partition protein [Pseudomonadota bacterium]
MAEREATKRLGRGLAALIGDAAPTAAPPMSGATDRGGAVAQKALVADLEPNPRNPRKTFAEADLDELAKSLRDHGLVQPIAVRPKPGTAGRYEIIAGERRWRAAQRAQLHDVPIVIIEATDAQALELAIIENVQRTDLNSIEEALGYEQLMTEFGYSQGELGDVISKSRSHVANTLRLLKLPDSVKTHLASGDLSAGHARALIGQDDAGKLADMIVAKGLSVRQVEALAQEARPKRASTENSVTVKDADTRALEKQLSDMLGLKIDIRDRGEKGGELSIRYATLEQLDDICNRLRG